MESDARLQNAAVPARTEEQRGRGSGVDCGGYKVGNERDELITRHLGKRVIPI